MKDLFHGTTYDIDEIDVTMGKGYKDFGKGFYATSVKSHAERIARRNKRILEAREAKIRQKILNTEQEHFRRTDITWNLMTVALIIRKV